MFQTIYTFRILSFQNSARRAVLQILFITHSAKIISVHTAPPIAQMLRNLSSVLIPDIRAEAICVRRKWNTKPRNSGSGGFYKYMPNLHGGHWGSSFIYVCFCLLVPPGACFPMCLQGLLPAWGEEGRMELNLLPEDCPHLVLGGSLEQSKDHRLQIQSLLVAILPPCLTLPSSSMKWGQYHFLSTGCCEDSMKCSIDVSSFIQGVYPE